MTRLWFACLWFAFLGQNAQKFRPVDFAPDGDHFAVMTGGQLTILGQAGMPPHPVPDSQGGYAPRYSRDGKYLVFAADNGGTPVVKLYDVAKDKTNKIIDNGLPPFEWRGDNDTFVATRKGDDGKLELLRYHPSVSDLYKVEPLPVTQIVEDRFVWLANTDDVAFIGDDGNVYLDEAGQTVKLTSTGDVTGLVISPDGKRLIWTVRNPDARAQLLTLYSMVIDSRTVAKLDFPQRPLGRKQSNVEQVEEVVFAPDQEHFALLVSYKDKPSKQAPKPGVLQAVYVTRLDGREFRQILEDRYVPEAKTRPLIWSRGGQLLAVSTRDGAALSVYDVKQHTGPRLIALQ